MNTSTGPVIFENQFSEFLRDVMAPPDASDFSACHPTWSSPDFRPRNVLDFGMDTTLDFNITDMTFLDQLCPRTAPDVQGLLLESPRMPLAILYQQQQQQPQPYIQEQRRDSHRYQQLPRTSTGSESPESPAGFGLEAFQKSSLSRWLPAQQDNVETQLNQLSVMGEGTEPSPTRLVLEQRPLVGMLDTRARDRLLAMILSTCDAGRAAAIAATFPPRSLLDDLIQNYFSHSRKSSASFIHEATFNPNTQRTELVAAAISGGAVLSDIKALQDLGYAIQEAIRLTIPKRCESANAVTREIWLVQTLMCEVEIGLWSGNRRKMEISESHTQTLFTVGLKALSIMSLPWPNNGTKQKRERRLTRTCPTRCSVEPAGFKSTKGPNLGRYRRTREPSCTRNGSTGYSRNRTSDWPSTPSY